MKITALGVLLAAVAACSDAGPSPKAEKPPGQHMESEGKRSSRCGKCDSPACRGCFGTRPEFNEEERRSLQESAQKVAKARAARPELAEMNRKVVEVARKGIYRKIRWEESIEKALEKARKDNKPLLIPLIAGLWGQKNAEDC